MKKVVVDAEGKLTIPPHILAKRGLRPGDELTLVDSDEGLLIYQCGSDPVTARWSGLSEDERSWNEGAEAIRAETEDERVDLRSE